MWFNIWSSENQPPCIILLQGNLHKRTLSTNLTYFFFFFSFSLRFQNVSNFAVGEVGAGERTCTYVLVMAFYECTALSLFQPFVNRLRQEGIFFVCVCVLFSHLLFTLWVNGSSLLSVQHYFCSVLVNCRGYVKLYHMKICVNAADSKTNLSDDTL